MHAGFTGVEWFGAIRTFNAAQIMLLNQRCAPLTTNSTLSNISPVVRPLLGGGGGGGIGFGGYGGDPWWMFSMWDFLAWVDSIQVGGQPDWSNEGPPQPRPKHPPILH